MKPYFSVIMPLYNHADFVNEAVTSVIHQTFDNWELIICNDGSTDDSLNRIAGITDNRIKIISKPNAGCASALNTCLLNSQGRYICWLSSDDVYAPNKLQQHFIHQNFHPERLITIAPHGEIIGDKLIDSKQTIPTSDFRLLHFLTQGNYINGLSPSIARDVYSLYGQFQEYKYVPDVQRWFTFFKNVEPYYFKGNSLSFSRMGTSSTSGVNYGAAVEMPRFLYKELLTKGPEIFLTPPENYNPLSQASFDKIMLHVYLENNILRNFALANQLDIIFANWIHSEKHESLFHAFQKSVTEQTIKITNTQHNLLEKLQGDLTNYKYSAPISFSQHLLEIGQYIQGDELKDFVINYCSSSMN